MNSFKNSRKDRFLSSFPHASIDKDDDLLASRCKFNFAYFEVQSAGQNFSDFDQRELSKILDKLKEFSKESLDYWANQRIGGKNGKVFSIYGAFPKNSDFSSPKHVPHQAEWGRFRIDQTFRLCGFIIPKSYDGKTHRGSGGIFCSNTFYIVFLDNNHRFYKTND